MLYLKRHEYLRSAILAFVAAVIFLAAGVGVTIVLTPMISDGDHAMKIFLFVPLCMYAFGAFLAIVGIYGVLNDRQIENGTVIEADVTGITEFFVGSGTKDVRYNLFCEAVINGRKYRFSRKAISRELKETIKNKKVNVKINPADPRQYYIML